jgi:predicted phage baseplate assembly protein
VVDGVYLNTQWAANTRTIEDEILGSSDGAHEQVFECAYVPVIDIEVWVDEQGSLSASQQQTLLEQRPEAVERATEPDGSVSAFWVRWTAVEDFLDSGPQDRHYVVDRTSGTVGFGDGQHGQVPPSGQDNVRATYTTGGGSEGNVESGAVTDLRSSISLVESVTNHAPADGGAAAESPSAVASRAPSQLKTREKAVSASDFEAVAMAVTRELAKVKCEPEMTPDGERESGWVTLLIVPEARREQPVPSLELQERIQRAVSERAPATLVAQEGSRIVVRGPSYVAVSVDASVRMGGVKSISTLKSEIESALDDYLHPLTGRDGEGWSFGTLPTEEALAERLGVIDGVDAVLDLTVTVETGGDTQPVAVSREDGVARDTLVCSGDHDIAVTMEGIQ